MARRTMVLLTALLPLAVAGVAATPPPEAKVDGYLEWRSGDLLIVDGQRVRPAPRAKFSGKGEARNVSSIPLGYELKAKGNRTADGVILAREIEAKPNGSALFESEVIAATDEAEQSYRRAGRFFETDANGHRQNKGRLYESGPEVDRVRRVVDTLTPPYVEPGDFRVYVIDNKDWNAFAMGNRSIYVYTGLLHDLDDDIAMFTRPLGNYIKLEVHACVSSWRRVDDNSIPARGKIIGAYVNSAFARSEAHWNGFDEAIVLDQEGHVSEGSAENIFVVRNGEVFTPSVKDNILEGITRATLIELMRDELGLKVTERSIDRSELYVAEEVFFCGTGAQVAAVTEIDHRMLGRGGTGPVTRRVQELYFRVVRGNEPKYMDWLTPINA